MAEKVNCENCLHKEICLYKEVINDIEIDIEETGCEYFQNKSLFIELPCSLGETLWRVCRFNVTTDSKEAVFVRAVELNKNNFYRIIFGGEYGKIVFKTKEEAIKVMEGMKNDELRKNQSNVR